MTKVIEGTVINGDGGWSFKTESNSFSNFILIALDELLDYETEDGERYRITIERLEEQPRQAR